MVSLKEEYSYLCYDVDDVKSITTNLRKIDEIKTVTRIEKFEDQPN